MKQLKQLNVLLIALVILAAGCATGKKSEGYTVKAKIDNPQNYGPYYLAYPNDGDYIVDTSYTVDGDWIIFKGKVKEPVVASFGLRGNPSSNIETEQGIIPGPSLNFFLSNEEIKIEGNADSVYMAKVTGGKANAEWAQIKSEENQIEDENWQLMKSAFGNAGKESDSESMSKLQNTRMENAAKAQKLRADFIAKNQNSIVSMYFLAGSVNDLSLEQLKEQYAKLGEEHKNSSYGKMISDKISSMEATAIGVPAIAINKNDINSNPVDLEKLKGKYVLLDFWGSWCVPCRQSFPHLKDLYAKYKDEGFEIVGIAQEGGQSIEDSRNSWKKAIEEDGLPWIQVLNNEDIDKYDVVKSYGVSAFPTQILLDKDGKIMARYVGESADLDQKLKEAFNK